MAGVQATQCWVQIAANKMKNNSQQAGYKKLLTSPPLQKNEIKKPVRNI
jgi:hypothetical protein